MILALIPDAIKLPAAAVIGAGLMFFPAKWVGQSEGKQIILASLKDDKITILEEGKKIDAEAIAADDDGLCVLLGGCLQDDSVDEPVRRSGEDRPKASDEQLSCEK
ncbi:MULTISPECIES: hypothetical protein [unclassified Sinorhizobium]|uniref:hypothetical protein n=1 Tax=unclassified Sinorhizobium TaxID=2613772 RepID=UPI003524F9D0